MRRDPPAVNMSCCIPLLCFVFLGSFNYAAPKPVGAQGINCSVTKLHGQTTYQLSVDPGCENSWEDANRTVLATDAEYDTNRVVHRDARSLTVRGCLDWLQYSYECISKNGGTVCSTSCSRTSEEVVQNGTTLVIVCVSGALLVFMVLGLLLCCCKTRIRRAYDKVLEWGAGCRQPRQPVPAFDQL